MPCAANVHFNGTVCGVGQLLSVFHGAENGITFALTQMLLTLPIMYVNRKYYITGFKTLFHGAPNMDSLIAIGSGAAFAYGIIAIYCIGYGLGHGDKEFAHSYMINFYFRVGGNDTCTHNPRKIS